MIREKFKVEVVERDTDRPHDKIHISMTGDGHYWSGNMSMSRDELKLVRKEISRYLRSTKKK